jgi:transcriptional regulator with XRE-family HTH domain
MKDALDLKIKKVAQNIRKIREYRNYTQEYLAAKLRISQNAYSKIELGHTRITIDRLLYIADVLGVDPIAILNIDDSEILSTVKSNSA